MIVTARGAITETSAQDLYGIGNQTYDDDGNLFTWQQVHASATAPGDGSAVYRYAAATPFVVTAAGAAGNLFAGVANATVAVSSYGWFMTDGEDTAVRISDASSTSSMPAGSPLYASATAHDLDMIQLGISSVLPLTNYLACGIVTTPMVSSTSIPRHCGARIKAIA